MAHLTQRIRQLLRKHGFLFALLVAVGLFVANVIVLPAFVAVDRWDTTLATFAPFAILAIASTPAVMTGGGGLDLSIAPSANLANVVLVNHLLTNSTLASPWVAIPIVLAITTAIGLFNGFLVAFFRVSPVVLTVGMLLFLLGLNDHLAPEPTATTAGWIMGLNGDLGPIPWGLVLIAIPLAIWGLTRLTAFYPMLYFVGGNQATAFSAGLSVTAVRAAAYGFGGLFAGIGGLAITGVFRASDPNVGLDYSLIAVAAVALGGTPLGNGGRGGVIGSLLGAAVIYLLDNLLIVANVPNQWLQVAYGGVLIVGATVGAAMAQAPKTRAKHAARAAAA